MKSNQEKEEADRKAHHEAIKEMMEVYQEQMKKMRASQEQMMSRMNANQVKADDNLREIRKEIQSVLVEMKSIVNAWRE
jgi:hypothetical protein